MNKYIKEFSKIFSPDECDQLIEFHDKNAIHDSISFWHDEKHSNDLKEISTLLTSKLLPCITGYFADFSGLFDSKDLYIDNFLITKHGVDFFDDLHFDTPLYKRGDRTGFRPFICMIYLNHHDFSGGQVIFPVEKFVLEPEQGKVVIFPSSFQFPHMVSSIAGGNRYSIRVTYNSTGKKLDLN